MDPALPTQFMAQAILIILNALLDVGRECFDGRDGRMTEAEVREGALRVLDGRDIGPTLVIEDTCHCAECEVRRDQCGSGIESHVRMRTVENDPPQGGSGGGDPQGGS